LTAVRGRFSLIAVRLLLTNDDGFPAPGLTALAAALAEGHEISLVAPEVEQSGVSQAITLVEPIKARQISNRRGFKGWAISGTPADCVKLAVWELLADRRPEMVVAGINRGANTGLNIFYSGTVAAAREAAMLGLPALALSLASRASRPDFGPAARLAGQLIERLAARPLPPGLALNVNIPARPDLSLSLCRLTRQAKTPPLERFIGRHDPRGNLYFWQDEEIYRQPFEPLSDQAALAEGLISITPIHFDLTAHEERDQAARCLGLPERP